jgi:phosphatidylglycerophosphate synthase
LTVPKAKWDLGAAVKPVDCWWTVAVIDPVAMRVLPVLLRFRRATPNLITGLAFVVGIASIASFASSRWVVGAVLYELRFFLDCLDGKVARVRKLSSPAGAMFDRLADMVSIPAAYAAIGWSLAREGHVPERLALLTAGAALLVSGLEAVLEVTRAKQPAPARPPADAPATGLVGWARRHRLTLRPWTVEAETLGLFLGPLLLRGDALGASFLGVVALYGAFAVVDVVLIFGTTTPQNADNHIVRI